MHKIHETLGDIIKAAQQKAGITNEELAAKVGVSERYIYRIENEGKKPSFDVLYKLINRTSMSSVFDSTGDSFQVNYLPDSPRRWLHLVLC